MNTFQIGSSSRIGSARVASKKGLARKSLIVKAEAKQLSVQVLTPEKQFFSDVAKELIIPTSTGQVGILPEHAPMITALDVGVMLLQAPDSGEWKPLALMGGFALVSEDNVTILVNGCETDETVDADQVNRDYEEALKSYEKIDALDDKERVEATLAFKRARTLKQLVE